MARYKVGSNKKVGHSALVAELLKLQIVKTYGDEEAACHLPFSADCYGAIGPYANKASTTWAQASQKE